MSSSLQIATVSIAGIASIGIGAVLAAVVTAIATSRREKRNWLRTEQIAAYRRFLTAVQIANDRIAYGEIAAARRENNELALARARPSIEADLREISNALPDVIATGGPLAVKHCAGLAAAWEQWMYFIVPLPGAQGPEAIRQSRAFAKIANQSLINLMFVTRVELGSSSRKLRAGARKLPVPSYLADISVGDRRGRARQILVEWRVRDWDGAIPGELESYVREDYPWARLDLDHPNLFQEIAAMARKGVGGPWRLAISSDLDAGQVDALEVDAARLVAGNVGGWPTKYGAHGWISGTEDGERLFLWTVDDLVQTLMQGNDGESTDASDG